MSQGLPTVGGMDETNTTPDTDTTGPDAEQATLPFDAALDEPIAFTLTARARRAIAPDTLPELTVLSDEAAGPDADGGGDAEQTSLTEILPTQLDDPHDTRTARARALRHAGVDVDQIADELDIDPLAVRVWVDDITPVRSASRRLHAVDGRAAPTRAQRARHAARRRRADEAFAVVRSTARRAARDRVAADPGFVSGLGLVSGVAELSPQAVVLTTRDVAVGRAAMRWLAGTLDIDLARVRVLLRLAPQVAADVARHAWHDATGLPTERITHTRWRQAPTAASVEAMIRIADPQVAGALAGWRDALLGSFDDEATDDVAW